MENASIGGIGMKLGGKYKQYVIGIIGTDPLYWGGGRFNSEKLEGMTYF